jgi:hypothetical protein
MEGIMGSDFSVCRAEVVEAFTCERYPGVREFGFVILALHDVETPQTEDGRTFTVFYPMYGDDSHPSMETRRDFCDVFGSRRGTFFFEQGTTGRPADRNMEVGTECFALIWHNQEYPYVDGLSSERPVVTSRVLSAEETRERGLCRDN